MIRPKYLIFAVIFAMMGYVLVHNERFLVEPQHPMWPHFAQYGWWILTHGLAGAVALFLAPLQFSNRLRKRYTTLHRISGYVYATGILFLAPLGAYVQYMAEIVHHGPRSFTVLPAPMRCCCTSRLRLPWPSPANAV